MQTHTISVLVENEFGVLARVAGMFAARGYNIDSLAVGTTHDPKFAHITVVATGNEHIIEQIVKQLNRLIDVIEVKDLTAELCVNREVLLCRVSKSSLTPSFAQDLRTEGAVRQVEESAAAVIFECSGSKEITDRFLESLKSVEVLELVRTGTAALPHLAKVQ